MTTRKTRSDSADAVVRAFQVGNFAIPKGVTLRECDLPFWRSAVACRNDWSDAELSMVAALARCKADIERLHRELDGEGERLGRVHLQRVNAEASAVAECDQAGKLCPVGGGIG